MPYCAIVYNKIYSFFTIFFSLSHIFFTCNNTLCTVGTVGQFKTVTAVVGFNKRGLMAALLNFHDAVLYTRDVKNFEVGNWLNDACIGFCLRHMEYVEFPNSPFILFMDPSVVSLIKVQYMDEEDLAGISRGLQLQSRKLLIVPTNDNNSFEGQ